MVKKYIPEQGDICFVDINPTKGHEQKGYRPVLVISSKIYSINTGMAVICPITSNNKFFPLHYELLNTKEITGSVECEHIRSVDCITRKFKFVEKINKLELVEIIKLLFAIIELE